MKLGVDVHNELVLLEDRLGIVLLYDAQVGLGRVPVIVVLPYCKVPGR